MDVVKRKHEALQRQNEALVRVPMPVAASASCWQLREMRMLEELAGSGVCTRNAGSEVRSKKNLLVHSCYQIELLRSENGRLQAQCAELVLRSEYKTSVSIDRTMARSATSGA